MMKTTDSSLNHAAERTLFFLKLKNRDPKTPFKINSFHKVDFIGILLLRRYESTKTIGIDVKSIKIHLSESKDVETKLKLALTIPPEE